MLVELRCWKGREGTVAVMSLLALEWRGKVRGWELVTHPAIAERCCGVSLGVGGLVFAGGSGCMECS